MEVDYESDENASMVYAALAVDKEVILHDAETIFSFFFFLGVGGWGVWGVGGHKFKFLLKFHFGLQLQPDKVKRQMSVSNGKLTV